jgi:hypothetical protein
MRGQSRLGACPGARRPACLHAGAGEGARKASQPALEGYERAPGALIARIGSREIVARGGERRRTGMPRASGGVTSARRSLASSLRLCQSNGRSTASRKTWPPHQLASSRESAPLGQRTGSRLFVSLASDEMAFLIEMFVDRARDAALAKREISASRRGGDSVAPQRFRHHGGAQRPRLF